MKNCPICSSAAELFHARVADYEYGTNTSVDYNRCSACQLLFQTPRPAVEVLKSYYPHDYRHHVQHVGKVPLFLKFLSWLKNIQTDMLVAKCAKFISSPDSKILEFGCGAGQFIKALSRAGYKNLTGIDQNPELKKVFQDSPIQFITGTVGESLTLQPPYDTIIMHSVIEHIVEPLEFLTYCKKILSPNGSVIIRTPNANSICHSLYGRYWAGLQAPRHIWLFNENNLKNAALQAGFAGIDWIRIEDPSGWAFSMQNLISSLLKTRPANGSNAWYTILSMPLWMPCSWIESWARRPSTLFCAIKNKADG